MHRRWAAGRRGEKRRPALVVALVVAAIALPFAFGSDGFLQDATVALAYTVMALGLNVVVGFAGLLDLGYVAFFAIGAYTTAWFASGFFSSRGIHFAVSEQLQRLPGIHLNYLAVVALAAMLSAFGGAAIGLPTLRLRGDYIAVVTMAFGEIIGRTVVNGDDGVFGLGHFNLTNGRRGINPVDRIDLPVLGPFSGVDLRPWYWLALFMAVLATWVSVRLRDSRVGRAWIAVREDEVAAVSMGVPAKRVKLLAYSTGAAMGGIAGSFIGAFYEQVNADQFAFSFSIFVLAMVVVGGL